jgi:hypothetical protein
MIAELELFAKQYLSENYTPQFGDNTEISVDSICSHNAYFDMPSPVFALIRYKPIFHGICVKDAIQRHPPETTSFLITLAFFS